MSNEILSYLTESARPSPEELRGAEARVRRMLGRDSSGPAQGAATENLPFSFTLDGQQSAGFIGDWAFSDETGEETQPSKHTWVRRTFSSPDLPIRVVWRIKWWPDFPAVEWVITFENTGDAHSPVLADVRALDLVLPPAQQGKTVLHAIRPDLTSELAYVPYEEPIADRGGVELASLTGRSSGDAFPFFTLEHGSSRLVVGIGWSGRWKARAERDATGAARVRAGLAKLSARLRPGESVRSPRVLLLLCEGDTERAHNVFRALMLAHVAPRYQGELLRPPMAAQNFDIYFRTRPEWSTETGQVAFVREKVAGLGFDTYWLDAAWFPRSFPSGVGSWFADLDRFPNGLRPIADEAHKERMRFLVWFETGRVAPDTQIWNEHPEWVMRSPEERQADFWDSGLFDYGNPEARRWLAQHVLSLLEEYGIDVYREDFNFDPARFWDARDEPERVGLAENRWVQGFYDYWDSLLAARPGLLIDNCAGGGHRIDLETCARSIPLWRSDTGCSPGNSDGDQTQSAGLSRYVPLNTVGCHSPLPYDVRSTATSGLIAQWDLHRPDFDRELAKSSMAEAKRFQEFWLGEMHPLIPPSPGSERWHALQLHREDLKAGIILVFRRGESPQQQATLEPQCLRSDETYEVTFVDEERCENVRRARGEDLRREGIQIELRRPRSSVIVYYRVAAP
jgi:alpha-galactosidase